MLVARPCSTWPPVGRRTVTAAAPARVARRPAAFRSGSLGPSITTADDIADPHDLRVRTLLNRKVMQDDHTSNMLFNLNAIIAHISDFTPLFPGDIISSGTPSGVGFAKKPPKFMFHGDRLRMEIDQLDPLENVVEDES